MSTKPPIADGSWSEPPSPASTETPPVYPYNNITQTESGHTFEMDDTPARERIRLNHRSGTFIEMHPNGDEVHKVYGDGYEITIKDKNVQINGTCNITINGDSNIHVLGNKNERIDGDYNMEVRGNMTQRCRGTEGIKLLSDYDMSITSNPDFGGSLFINCGAEIILSGDLMINGQLVADQIDSRGRLNSGPLSGVYAGVLGFVSPGGLTVGFPVNVAVPGVVTAPNAKFGTMNAVLMTDVINKTLHNFHIHNSPKGPTSTPLLKMI